MKMVHIVLSHCDRDPGNKLASLPTFFSKHFLIPNFFSHLRVDLAVEAGAGGYDYRSWSLEVAEWELFFLFFHNFMLSQYLNHDPQQEAADEGSLPMQGALRKAGILWNSLVLLWHPYFMVQFLRFKC